MKKIVLLLILLLSLVSCKTKTVVVTVPEVRTEYIVKRDSVHLHDSIYVQDSTMFAQLGDTIRIEKWHTKYVDRWRDRVVSDTLIKIDSIPVPYPVPEYVEKPLNWWQKTKMGAGVIAMLLMLVWIVWQAAKIYLKRF